MEYFRNFLLRGMPTPGPFAVEADISDLLPGDFIQLNFKGNVYSHTPIIVAIGRPVTPENILLAAHSYDVDYRPLSTYTYQSIRYLHILGANPPENFTPAPPDQPSFSPWV